MDSNNGNQKGYMLTTVDNPYDPYTQFKFWYGFDMQKRVVKGSKTSVPIITNCCGKLADEAITSDNFTEEENAIERQRAIDEIIRNDKWNIYKKAYPKSDENSSD